ncbi:MAG: Crp/Fnr family transcriptional regulator [Haliscomenobacter sp.]|nr:Crp/Fnr family transcriptional regulator [Haliscomenobacter sp.]MBP9076724.1 Crp/Fnr family transcriptional regulator [Haliscomenobacter sp.]
MRIQEKTALDQIHQIPLFRGLAPEETQLLENLVETRLASRGQFLFEQGTPSDRLFYLRQGLVKVGVLSEDSREVIKYFLSPGAFFGESGILGEPAHLNFALTISQEAQVFCFPQKVVMQLMQQNAPFMSAFMTWLGSRLRQTEKRLEGMFLKDARERIIDFIKDSAQKQGEKIGFETLIRHSLTQQDIANFTGTSRQTVTSVLNELRKSNLIHFTRRSILIRDLAKLT